MGLRAAMIVAMNDVEGWVGGSLWAATGAGVNPIRPMGWATLRNARAGG